MASDDGLLAVESATELLSRTELTEIRTYLLHGERTDPRDGGDSNISVSARSEAEWIEVRCRMSVTMEDATLTVDRSAVFTHAEPLELAEGTVREFVEKVGVMTVYPYLRESAFTLASGLGVSPPVMALLRAGSVRLGATAADAGGTPPASVKRSRPRKSSSGD